MMYIIVALIFGVVASTIACDKGRSIAGWFVAGVMIGPFALAVIALPTKPRHGRYAECPACLEIVKDEAMVCRFCGTAFE
jgi:hypothetical protein